MHIQTQKLTHRLEQIDSLKVDKTEADPKYQTKNK